MKKSPLPKTAAQSITDEILKTVERFAGKISTERNLALRQAIMEIIEKTGGGR